MFTPTFGVYKNSFAQKIFEPLLYLNPITSTIWGLQNLMDKI